MDWPKIQLPPAKVAATGELASRQGTMYGMLLESVQHYVQRLHGNEAWRQIMLAAGVQNMVFTTHGRYSDSIILRLSGACAKVMMDRTRDEYMCFFGQCFVEYCSHYGYDKIMRISGRHYRDFLRGIDNLHETMRFSYPKMINPSLYVEEEDCKGCILHYRSKRIGFTYYVIGQLTQFATLYYNVRVDIDVLKEEVSSKGCHVTFRLNFDNVVFNESPTTSKTVSPYSFPAVTQATFFKVFPFSLVFNSDLVVSQMGSSLRILFDTDLVGKPICDSFLLRRPPMEFTFENVMCRQSVMFELEIPRHARNSLKGGGTSAMTSHMPGLYSQHNSDVVLLKGQMKFIPDLDGIAFLCTPLLGNLDDLDALGLKINDLSMFDFSRDMVLRGWQHSSALEYTIEKQVQKSEKISENLRQLDEWKSRSEQLLYAMIPRSVAERLKEGEDPINTCQVFDSVTIMFCYLVGFTDLCNHLPALQCIETINFIFSTFDAVVDDYDIFKVETLGDAVYMAAGGVPDPTTDHGVRVAGVALTLKQMVEDRSMTDQTGQAFNIRIGLHTGGVVAGVVGKRTPQYCLFGDTVNTASRMQTYSQPGGIHISESCQKQLQGHGFITKLRGTMDIKGKGSMQTYWLVGREGGKEHVNPAVDTYTEFCQTTDEPNKVVNNHRGGKDGFTMGTTVECRTIGPEDEDEKDVEVDLSLPEKPVTNTYPKINVEDFKTFLAGKSTSGTNENSSNNALTCPYSGITLGEADLLDALSSKDDKTHSHRPIKRGKATPRLASFEEQPTDQTLEGDVLQHRRTSNESGLLNVGRGRRDRRRSLSGLMLLDEYRTSIDGATNRLSEDFKNYSFPSAAPSHVKFGFGLSRSLSPNAFSFPTLSSSSASGLNIHTSRSCKDLKDLQEAKVPKELKLKQPTRLVSSYFSEATKFWQQCEQKAMASRAATNGHVSEKQSKSPSDKVLMNGFGHSPDDTKSPKLNHCSTPVTLNDKSKDNKLGHPTDSKDSISTGTCSLDEKRDVEGIFDMDDMCQ